jgi:hypothetical protein
MYVQTYSKNVLDMKCVVDFALQRLFKTFSLHKYLEI